MPIATTSREPVTTQARRASEAPNSSPISGRTRLAMSLAMTISSMAGATTAMSAGSETVFSALGPVSVDRSEEHTSELQSRENLVCRLLLEKKKNNLARESQ